jgi:hypothetical protein
MTARSFLAAVIVLGVATPAFSHHVRYTANLTGPAESPANDSPGLGHVVVTLDLDLGTMEVETTFSGL